MTDPPRVNLSRLRSTSKQLKQTSTTFTNNIFTLLFLSLILYSFRSLVENGSHVLTSFIDRDASLKSLLSRIDFSDHHPSTARLHRHSHRRRQLLHLTRVGTLGDDFFSGDDFDRSLYDPQFRRPLNGTPVALSYSYTNVGFSSQIVDNGIEVLKIVHSGVAFKTTGSFDRGEVDSDRDGAVDNEQNNDKDNGQELESIVDLQLFIKGLELGGRDAAALFFLVSFLSAAYGWVILGFTAVYSWVLGIVFVTVCNDLIGKFSSFGGVLWDGSRLGLKRLTGFILMRWAVRDALTQLLGLWFFGEIEDQYSFFKLFVRLKLMPFSIMSPWIRGFEKEVSWFLFTWVLLDTMVAFIFAVDAWIAIVDPRKTGREIVKEGVGRLIWREGGLDGEIWRA
ncbi:transmembrane protein [Citrus sinensis]|uniref:Transmembrane protein n=1 Tax=Citrus sinensis TaxID=2711 RepID=A0ACB8JTK2_CITSI|nr:transmembrane protein [Citrus sinensis]